MARWNSFQILYETVSLFGLNGFTFVANELPEHPSGKIATTRTNARSGFTLRKSLDRSMVGQS
jgi:hypothetical protein